ncbi:MAG TPA: hypothetical protein VKM93_10355 [Terriglobia bacterium]|nr:hypothetical protein [Terriglobia bacterium]
MVGLRRTGGRRYTDGAPFYVCTLPLGGFPRTPSTVYGLPLGFSLILFLAALAAPVYADTIYQNNSQGKRVVIQRDAILVKQDSAILTYKHFDLQQRRVTTVTLNQGSLPYTVETSPSEARQQIVDVWKKFGYKVLVTAADGKTTRVFDAYLDFYPPGGRGSLLESVPAITNLPLSVAGGGVDVIDFSKIVQIEFQGDQLQVTLDDGRVEAGTFASPTSRPAEARLLGITDRYDPASPDVFDFSLALAKIKEVKFE